MFLLVFSCKYLFDVELSFYEIVVTGPNLSLMIFDILCVFDLYITSIEDEIYTAFWL